MENRLNSNLQQGTLLCSDDSRVAYRFRSSLLGAKAIGSVVVVHGLGSSKDSEGPLKIESAMLSRGFNTMLFDLYGHGHSNSAQRSSGSLADLTISKAVVGYQRILEFLQQRTPEFIGVIASSLGSTVALAGLNVQADVKFPDAICNRAPATDYRAVLHRILTTEEIATWKREGILKKPGLPAVKFEFYSDLDNHSADKLAEAVRRTKISLFCLHGTKDPLVPFNHTLRFEDLCFGANTAMLPIKNADHSLAPFSDRSVQAAASFLQLQAGKRRGLNLEEIEIDTELRERAIARLSACN